MEKRSLANIIADNFSTSNAEVRRIIGQGGLRIDGEVVAQDTEIDESELDGCQLQLGKNRFRRIDSSDQNS